MSEKGESFQGDGQPMATYAAPFLTPVNLILFALLGVMVWFQLRPRPAVTLPKQPSPLVFRTFTPRMLLPYNGRGKSTTTTTDNPTEDQASIYLAIKGRVYDVTPGRNFYGPQGPYANFAGRDASRGLACGSFEEDMLTKDLDGPLDSLDDLDDDQRTALEGWEESFGGKYLVVGRLVAEGAQGTEAGKA